ncbi:MAG: DUF1559 domain-containing protein [Abitibacteriaceae bacterium]|nr:DUF1559 domain-containing protein [Abditibacteriaceae bacterium]
MSDNRYISVGDDVYIDQKKPQPFPWGWIIGIVAFAGLCVLILMPMPMINRAGKNAYLASCQNNLRQVALGFLQYQQDNEERFPPVSSSSLARMEMAATPPHDRLYYGWADALQPYLKSTQLYQCPAQKVASDPDPTHSDYTDYWFNSNLSAFNGDKLHQPARTLLLGDGNNNLDGTEHTDARYSLAAFPPTWFLNEATPPYRHLGGANYAFADGHVKWLKPAQFQTLSGVYYTFKVHPPSPTSTSARASTTEFMLDVTTKSGPRRVHVYRQGRGVPMGAPPAKPLRWMLIASPAPMPQARRQP